MNKSQLLQSLKQQKFPKQILKAFEKVKREDLVSEKQKKYAYEDTALPIGKGQTISQPYTIAVMLSMLELHKKQKVLEVGSGSGYVLALISEIVGPRGRVYGIERIKELADRSKVHLKNYKNIQVYNYDGSKGLEEKARFDRIIISAACGDVPKALLSQLKNDGVLVAPVNSTDGLQTLTAIRRSGNQYAPQREIPGFIFVPFIEG